MASAVGLEEHRGRGGEPTEGNSSGVWNRTGPLGMPQHWARHPQRHTLTETNSGDTLRILPHQPTPHQGGRAGRKNKTDLFVRETFATDASLQGCNVQAAFAAQGENKSAGRNFVFSGDSRRSFCADTPPPRDGRALTTYVYFP